MKKLFSFLLIACFGALIGVCSCKKYDDGPVFSLTSKKSRVVNVWKLNQLYIDAIDATSVYNSLFPDYSVEFKTDNSYIITWTGSSVETGDWSFDSSKENILLTPSNESFYNTWKILKLKSNELWAQYKDCSGMNEVHLEPK